jgi:ATP-dependent RNA helicase RhlE
LVPEIERIASFALTIRFASKWRGPRRWRKASARFSTRLFNEQKIDLLVTLVRNTEMRSVLVFTRTKHGADRLAHRLEKAGYPAEILHSNRTQRERTEAMDNFRLGKSQILVATDIAARGHRCERYFPRHQFDVPQHPEDYVHRVGRTARAYGVGDAITLMDPLEQVL